MEHDQSTEEPMDWVKAKDYLDLMMALYAGIGWAGAYGLAIMRPLAQRFADGERTRELYDAIMDLE